MRIVILLALSEVEGSEPALAGKSKDLNALLGKDRRPRSVGKYCGCWFEPLTMY
jgi:hypothetical protein